MNYSIIARWQSVAHNAWRAAMDETNDRRKEDAITCLEAYALDARAVLLEA